MNLQKSGKIENKILATNPQISTNLREFGQIFAHPRLRQKAIDLGLVGTEFLARKMYTNFINIIYQYIDLFFRISQCFFEDSSTVTPVMNGLNPDDSMSIKF